MKTRISGIGALRAAGMVLLAAAAAGSSGCALVRRGATSAMAPMAGSLAASLERQPDLDLVHEGAPAFLLLMDGLADSATDNPDLLLAAANAHAAYAAAFYGRDQAARARTAYAKARDYGLRVLSKRAAFRKALDGSQEVFETAVRGCGRADVPALYVAALGWAGWIVNNTDSVEAIGQFSRPFAMMERVLALDPAYQGGGADLFFGMYYAVRPAGAGRDLAKSKAHFEAAFRHAGPAALLPRVAFAECYARYAMDRDLFEKTLKDALARTDDPPDLRLRNEAARRRAKALLEQAEDLF